MLYHPLQIVYQKIRILTYVCLAYCLGQKFQELHHFRVTENFHGLCNISL